MKTLILFLFSFLAFCPKLFAQTVFAPQGAVWHYYLDGDGRGANYKFEVEKDTVYEGKWCSKVLNKSTKNATYFYTNGDTVFYFHDSIKSFTPLYIFNVKVGDTISLVSPPMFYRATMDTALFKITKIDTILIDGLSLKTIYTKSISTHLILDQYTERIGGYIGYNVICIDAIRTADHSVGLRCYSDQEIDEKFVLDKWDCDYVPNDIDEKALADNIRIFPNPVSEKLNLSFDKSIVGEINVLGIDGRILNQKAIEGNEIQIDMSTMSEGMYFLQVKTAQETFSRLISVLH